MGCSATVKGTRRPKRMKRQRPTKSYAALVGSQFPSVSRPTQSSRSIKYGTLNQNGCCSARSPVVTQMVGHKVVELQLLHVLHPSARVARNAGNALRINKSDLLKRPVRNRLQQRCFAAVVYANHLRSCFSVKPLERGNLTSRSPFWPRESRKPGTTARDPKSGVAFSVAPSHTYRRYRLLAASEHLARPADVRGPVDNPPCSRQRFLPARGDL